MAAHTPFEGELHTSEQPVRNENNKWIRRRQFLGAGIYVAAIIGTVIERMFR